MSRVLLHLAFNTAKPAIVIFLNVPLAVTGGIFALAGMPFSISAGDLLRHTTHRTG